MAQKGKSLESIVFLPEEKYAPADKRKSLLQVAVENKIKINHSCGGSGSCGTCLVRIREGLGSLPERTIVEAEMAADRGFSADERLACQTPAHSGLVVEVSFCEEIKNGLV